MINRIGWLLLLGAVCGPVMFRGGNWPNAVLLFQGLTAFALLCLGISAKNFPRFAYIGVALWLLWLCWLLLHCISLPPDLLQRLSPDAHAIHAAVAQQGALTYFSLSIAPSQSADHLQLSLYYFGLYLGLALALDSRQRVRALLLAIAVTASIQAIYAATNALTGFEIGLPGWQSHQAGFATGSFINRNHFAAYLTLAACCTAAALLGGPVGSRPQWGSALRRWLDFLISPYMLVRILLVTMVIAVVLSRSRMGNISLAIAFSTLAIVWLLGTRRLTSFGQAGLFFLSIAVLDIALISEQYGLQRVVERIEKTDITAETRPDAVKMGLTLLDRFGWVGAGPGSYGHLQESIRPSPEFPRYDHAHNDYLQFAIETGYIGLGLAGLLVGFHLLIALLATRRRLRLYRAVGASAAAGMLAALVHATVEFNFQIPGYAILFVTMMALATCSHRNRARHPPDEPVARESLPL